MLALEQLPKGSYFALIYKITNTINKKIYIGQTKDTLKKRKYGHLYSCNKHLQAAFKKYGVENFTWQIVCYIYYHDQFFLDDVEKYFINYYKSDDRIYGYNKTNGGINTFNPNKEFKKQISSLQKYNKKRKKFTKKQRILHKKRYEDKTIKEKMSQSRKKYFSNLSKKQRVQYKIKTAKRLTKYKHLAWAATSNKWRKKKSKDFKILKSLDINQLTNIKNTFKNKYDFWKQVKKHFCIDITFPNFKRYIKKHENK